MICKTHFIQIFVTSVSCSDQHFFLIVQAALRFLAFGWFMPALYRSSSLTSSNMQELNIYFKTWSAMLDQLEFDIWILFTMWHFIGFGFIGFFGPILFIWEWVINVFWNLISAEAHFSSRSRVIIQIHIFRVRRRP